MPSYHHAPSPICHRINTAWKVDSTAFPQTTTTTVGPSEIRHRCEYALPLRAILFGGHANDTDIAIDGADRRPGIARLVPVRQAFPGRPARVRQSLHKMGERQPQG